MPPSAEPDACTLDLGHSQGAGRKDYPIFPPLVATAINEDSSKTGTWLIVFGTWVGKFPIQTLVSIHHFPAGWCSFVHMGAFAALRLQVE